MSNDHSVHTVPAPSLSKTEVVERLLAVLRRDGFDGASLSVLSEATGLGKSSLYHHFPDGKVDMAAAVLDYLAETIESEMLAPLRAPGDPEARLRALMRAIDAFYRGGQEHCLLASLGIGESARRFHPKVSQIFEAWVEGIAGVLREAGVSRGKARARAEDALARIEGSLVMARGLGETALFARTLRNLPRELLAT